VTAPEPGAAVAEWTAYEALETIVLAIDAVECGTDAEVAEVAGSVRAIARHAIAAQEPQPAPGAAAPDRPNAKFTEWLELHNAQFGGNPTHEYGGGDMRDAYEAGMTAAVVAYACRPDLGAQADALTALRSGITGLAADLDRSARETAPSRKSEIESETAIALRRLLEAK
jgi:hypothetical protein